MTSTGTSTVTLPPSVHQALASAARDGISMIVAFVDGTGTTQLSYRGSTHLDGDARLSAWLRKKQGSLQAHVADGAEVDVVYRNPRAQAYYRLTGFARLATDPETCEHVYRGSPPHEQAADPQRAGAAMTVDITRVAGHDHTGDILVESDGGS